MPNSPARSSFSGSASEEPRRLGILEVDPQFITNIARNGHHVFRIENGIPLYADVRNSYVDHVRQTICIVLEHYSFAPVKFGELIPRLESPTFHLHRQESLSWIQRKIAKLFRLPLA